MARRFLRVASSGPGEEKLKEPAGCQRYGGNHESQVTSYESRIQPLAQAYNGN